MSHIPAYSLVIFPPLEQLDLIKSYKELLKKHIGWYNSVNSAGHITLLNFDNEMMLMLYIEQIREFCKSLIPQKVILNSFDSFGVQTFFIAPNQTSLNYLNQLIIDLHQHLDFKINDAHAHLSIARGLNATKIKTAYEIFSNIDVNLQFICNSFYLRKYNHKINQYSDIVEKIDFGNS